MTATTKTDMTHQLQRTEANDLDSGHSEFLEVLLQKKHAMIVLEQGVQRGQKRDGDQNNTMDFKTEIHRSLSPRVFMARGS